MWKLGLIYTAQQLNKGITYCKMLTYHHVAT